MKKKAEDLKPGDVLAAKDGNERHVICHIEKDALSDGRLFSRAFHIDSGCVFSIYWPAGQILEVESPALTPAQQHAEEMLELVRTVATNPHYTISCMREEAVALLTRIDPPKPPSAEELAQALEYSMAHMIWGTNSSQGNCKEVLDRARAAGMLKGDA